MSPLEDFLLKLQSPEGIVYVTPVVLVLLYILYKEWPELKKRVSAGPLKEKQMQDTDQSLAVEIRGLKTEITGIKEKLANDFARINNLERENDQIHKMAEASVEERRILMECTLVELRALQGMGADGETGIKKAENDLQNYLNRRAHHVG